MRLMLPLLFLVGVGLIELNLWKWGWMSTAERDMAIITILSTEFGGQLNVSDRLIDQLYQVVQGRYRGCRQ